MLAAGEVVIVHCYYTLRLNEARHVVVGVPLIPQYDAKVCMRACVTFGNNRNYAGQVIIVHCYYIPLQDVYEDVCYISK